MLPIKSVVPPLVLDGYKSVNRKRALREAGLKLAGVDKLNLGCGATLIDGWANVDLIARPGVVPLDLTWGLPVPAGSITAIFIEHMLEELSRKQADALLSEFVRVLRPSGVVRISTPDLRVLVDEYVSGRTDYWQPVGWTPETSCDLLNEGMRFWGNQYVYDRCELRQLLESKGFTDVRFVEWHESDHEHLRELETRPYHRELIVEATK